MIYARGFNDLKMIEKNPYHLVNKFNLLSARSKEDVINLLNICLELQRKYDENGSPKNDTNKEVTHRKNLNTIEPKLPEGKNRAEIRKKYDTAKNIADKYLQLSNLNQLEFVNAIKELFYLEPKRVGGQPTSVFSMYERLSLTSKVKATTLINKVLELQARGLKWSNLPQRNVENPIDKKIISFPSDKRGCELG